MIPTKSKYYIPDLSEFFVGFRCQMRFSIIENDLGKCTHTGYSEWEDIIFKNSVMLDNYRVKYLDKTDIEDLGWKYAPTEGRRATAGSPRHFFKLEYEGSCYHLVIGWDTSGAPETIRILRGVLRVLPNIKITTVPVFSGNLKNYNDLERLMGQLQIKS